MALKRMCYSYLCFGNEYYIAGVNILAESKNRTFVRNIPRLRTDICNDVTNVPFYKFSINNRKFKVAIKQLSSMVYLVSHSNTSLNVSSHIQDAQSVQRNKQLLYDFALKYNKDEESDPKISYVYSDDRKKRLEIVENSDKVILERQILCLTTYGEHELPPNLETDPCEYLCHYEGTGGPSYYSDFQSAYNDGLLFINTEEDQQHLPYTY